MVSQDWTAPPRSEPPPSKLHEWKVDVDQRSHLASGVAIYEIPPRTPGLDTHLRLVATLDRKEDAELIVSLYEQHRRAQ